MSIGIDERPPTLEERYMAATNTSDLTVATDRHNGAGDVVLAAGMVRNRLGMALLHLKSEWDRCDKPRKKTPAEIAIRAAEIKDKKGKPDVKRATVEALVQHAAAMRHRASTLTGRSVVMGLLTEWATFYDVDRDLLSPALFHFLSPTCPVCEGRGKMKIPDTPALSNKSCLHCRGEGTWPRPHGAERVQEHMKKALSRARGDMSRALFG